MHQSIAPLTRQTAIDWDSFELGSSFTLSQAKPGHFDLTEDLTRSQSRREKVDVGSGLTMNNLRPAEFDVGSALSRRHASNESRVTCSTAAVSARKNDIFTDDAEDHDDDGLL